MLPLPTSPLSLSIVRVLPASPERVYAAFTDVHLARQWWGPEGVTTLAFNAEVQVGGAWNWQLRSEDGEEMEAAGHYVELAPPEKLVFTWRWLDDEAWENVESTVTVEFRPHPDGTEMHFTHVGFPSEQSRNNHLGGWTSNADQLEKFLR